jgi:type I restriction enzyme R subunit
MVVTDSRVAAVRYKVEIDKYIRSKGYRLETIVAFSGSVDDPEYGIEGATESNLNPGLGTDLAREFRRPNYRVMLVADKFQTGFDQPLLCAMYVDKRLPDVHAVQTLSRLNRTYRSPRGEVKDRTFVLDFVNDPEDIRKAFEPYYTGARVESVTDPNIVHEIAAKLAEADIYTDVEVEAFAFAWFTGGGHAALAAAIKEARDRFARRYGAARDANQAAEVDRLELFRKDAGTFVRMYDFMSQVIDYASTDLEKLCVFLRQLIRVIETERLGSEVDLSDVVLKRIIQIDRGEANLALGSDEDAALSPISGAGSGSAQQDPQLVLLAELIAKINDLFGGELTNEQIEAFVKPVAAMAESNNEVQQQIDHNAEDQFLDSPDLRDAVIDAALSSEAAVGKLTGATTGDDMTAEQLIRLIGSFMYRSRRDRIGDSSDRGEAPS